MRHPLLVCALVLGTPSVHSAGIQTVWSQGYDSPQNDYPVALAGDSQNSVAVLVDSFGEVAVLKYSASGLPLWTNRYNSPLYDAPGGFGVGSDNSIYVTAVSTTDSLPGPLTLIKYASNGTQLWTRVGDVTNAQPKSPGIAVPPGIITDENNNVLVAVVTSSGYSILKYNAEGTPLWTNTYIIPSGSFSSTKYFGMDGNGNAVLVAWLSKPGNDQILTLRCSTSGGLSVSIYEWTGAVDFLMSATIDSAGNVFVAGSVRPPRAWSYHVFTAKFDAAGTLVWSRQRPPANGYHAVSRQIALDPAGNVIVTAYEQRPVSEDEDETQTLTLKYGPSGEELWSARAQGFDRSPTGLSVDAGGNIQVVSGGSFGGGAFVTRYRPNGSQAAETNLPGHSPGFLVNGAPGEFYLQLSENVETRKLRHVESESPLSATIAPASVEALPGTDVTFTAEVSGIGPFTYDWRYFGYRIGATNKTLTLTNVQYQWRSHGDYTVIVSNLTESTISPEARLSVLRPPTVAITPATLYVSAGEQAALTAAVSGTEPFSYAWHFNGQLIPGANQETLVYSAVAGSNAGYYTVVVSNRVGTVTSTAATLHVVLPPVSFSNPTTITVGTNGTGTPYPSEILVSGITHPVKITATVEGLTSGEPSELVLVLRAPGGAALVLMSNVGDDTTANALNLTFDDDAAGYVPDEYVASGSFKPGLPGPVLLPPPAPVSAWVATFGELLSGNLNGTWRLFVGSSGYAPVEPSSIANGWRLTFLQSDPDDVIRASIREIKRAGDHISIEWEGSSGWKLQRSDASSNAPWTDVPGSMGASQIQLPLEATNQFFRLAK